MIKVHTMQPDTSTVDFSLYAFLFLGSAEVNGGWCGKGITHKKEYRNIKTAARLFKIPVTTPHKKMSEKIKRTQVGHLTAISAEQKRDSGHVYFLRSEGLVLEGRKWNPFCTCIQGHQAKESLSRWCTWGGMVEWVFATAPRTNLEIRLGKCVCNFVC